jgi:hypothetical protein
MLMMKSIAQEVAPYRIRVNSVAPGAIRTPINMEAWGTPEAYRELMKLIPYKRIGEPEDIGRACVWLASDDSDYVHGTTLFVDGGMNPATTLTFLQLGRILPWDAAFYVGAQFIGGTCGVLLTKLLLGSIIAHPSVRSKRQRETTGIP